MTEKTGNPVGRPPVVIYDEAIGDRICDLLKEGKSLRQICLLPGIPSRIVVIRWCEQNPEFDAKCARAREWQADYMDDLILDTANACTPESSPADRVKIGAYQWRAARLKPKVYGERRPEDKSEERELTIKIVGGLPE
jgi:hypothetical protein